MAREISGHDGQRRIPWRLLGWGVGALFLLWPIAVGAPWSAADFVFAGAMIGIVGGGIELAVRRGNAAYTVAAGLALGAALLSAWIPGAVGIIGSEHEPANLLYPAVVLIALLGALVSLFRPRGMALAMAAAALAELLLPIAAWVLWPALRPAMLRPEVPFMTAVLTGLWAAAAWLFRKSAD